MPGASEVQKPPLGSSKDEVGYRTSPQEPRLSNKHPAEEEQPDSPSYLKVCQSHACVAGLFSEIHIYDLTCGFKNIPFSTPVYSLYSTFFPFQKWFISDNLMGNSTCQPALLIPLKVLHLLCGHPLLSPLLGTWMNIWPPHHWRNYKPPHPDLYILERLWNPLLQGQSFSSVLKPDVWDYYLFLITSFTTLVNIFLVHYTILGSLFPTCKWNPTISPAVGFSQKQFESRETDKPLGEIR